MKNSSLRFASCWRPQFSPGKGIARSGPACGTTAFVLPKIAFCVCCGNINCSPSRKPEPMPAHLHEGTIVATSPDQMWGTDATVTFTETEGHVTVFAAIDHYTAECVGIHAVNKATRFEALEPIRQAVTQHFGSFSARGCRRSQTAA